MPDAVRTEQSPDSGSSHPTLTDISITDKELVLATHLIIRQKLEVSQCLCSVAPGRWPGCLSHLWTGLLEDDSGCSHIICGFL